MLEHSLPRLLGLQLTSWLGRCVLLWQVRFQKHKTTCRYVGNQWSLHLCETYNIFGKPQNSIYVSAGSGTDLQLAAQAPAMYPSARTWIATDATKKCSCPEQSNYILTGSRITYYIFLIAFLGAVLLASAARVAADHNNWRGTPKLRNSILQRACLAIVVPRETIILCIKLPWTFDLVSGAFF